MAKLYVLPDQHLVECNEGETVLEAALRAGLPWAHACGGFAQCSTCRMAVVEGASACGERSSKESVVAGRLGFGDEVRLACETSISGPATVRRLVIDDLDLDLADARHGLGRRHYPRPLARILDALFGSYSRRRIRPRASGTEQDVAVLFADIRGFTPFVESVLAYDVIHVLERILLEMTRRVEAHGGRVTSYMGDGLMAVFGVGDPSGAAAQAVAAALEMLEVSERRSEELEALYGRTFDWNVGIHYGPAIVGALWGDVRYTTAVGDTVNTAARIEAVNKEAGTRLLVSQQVTEELGDRVVVGQSMCCALPGKHGEYTLLEIVALKDEPEERMPAE